MQVVVIELLEEQKTYILAPFTTSLEGTRSTRYAEAEPVGPDEVTLGISGTLPLVADTDRSVAVPGFPPRLHHCHF